MKNLFREIFDAFIEDLKVAHPEIPLADVEKIRHEALKRMEEEPPPRVAFIGQSGVGKSTTLNALFDAGQRVNHYRAQTQEPVEINVASGALVVYDMPGLGESRAKRSAHRANYERVLTDVDVALWILDAPNRDIEAVQEYLEDELTRINPQLIQRLVIGLNKVDTMHPGQRAWIPLYNLPSDEQEVNIKRRVTDVRRKMKEVLPRWRGAVVPYSAEQRYNLPQLFDAMLDAVPKGRQWVLATRKALADFLGLVDPNVMPLELRYRQNSTAAPVTQEEIIARVRNLSPDEFAEIGRSREGFEEWLRRQTQSG
jgi:uncharacterized protein